jgi:DNA topoisomerase I
MTRIEHLQTVGIRRIGTPKTGFEYKKSDGGKVSAEDLNRIDELRIPPAWTDVAINPAATGKLQAIGKDAAGRWQYLYHQSHVRKQEAKKFKRLIKFAEALPKMRATISGQLRQQELGKEKVLACILRVLSTCFMRPGSQVYASEHGSYGLATLRSKHVKVKGDVVEFDFPGKSGVRQQRELKDRHVAKVIKSLLKYPGREVFKFPNGSGELVKVTSRHINEYIKDIMGESFTAKDFRTWAGTLVCASALARVSAEALEKRGALKRSVVAAIKETAELLGNTPAVCRSAYICPEIIDGFEKGQTINGHLKNFEDLVSYRSRTLNQAERALLKFLKKSGSNH